MFQERVDLKTMPLKNGDAYLTKATILLFWELRDKQLVTESGFNPVVWITAVKNSSLLAAGVQI